MYTVEDGEFAIKAARQVLETYLNNGKVPKIMFPKKFKQEGGVFVTLHKYPSNDLRGCIGFPEPIFALKKAIPEAAVAAATKDPRFPPMKLKELSKVIIEVSLLTPPQVIRVKDPDKLPDAIAVGRDGLIASMGFSRGLLLPQVPVEQGWDAEMFLSHTCLKAGIPPERWRTGKVQFEAFQAKVFTESKPKGLIKEKM